MYQNQLLGRVLGPPERRPPAVAGILILIAVLSGLVFLFLKYRPPQTAAGSNSSEPRPPAAASMPVAEAEDFLRHLENAAAASSRAASEVKRSQNWTARVLPSIERNYMNLERRSLVAGLAAADSARRHIEQVREELDIVKNLLIERRTNATHNSSQ